MLITLKWQLKKTEKFICFFHSNPALLLHILFVVRSCFVTMLKGTHAFSSFKIQSLRQIAIVLKRKERGWHYFLSA